MRTATLLLLLSLTAIPARAASIVNTYSDTSLLEGHGGFWIGTMALDPGDHGMVSTVVGQSFETTRDYDGIFGTLALFVTGADDASLTATLDLSLAKDANGTPGEILTTTHLTVDSLVMRNYDFAFSSDIVLMDATRYWLVATSPNVMSVGDLCCSGSLPVWFMSGLDTPAPGAFAQNGGPWLAGGSAFLLSLDGREIGDSVPNNIVLQPVPLPSPTPAPEPASLSLLATGAVFTLARRRRG